MNLISVIIPLYNVEKYIERCARSLFDQTMEDIEYIFVDDCSTDFSVQILETILKEYPNRATSTTIIRHIENKGVSTVRNKGLSYATGEYIGWVDGDDWVDADMFEQLYNVAVKYDSDIVWSDFYNVYKNFVAYQSQACVESKVAYIRGLLCGTLHGTLCTSIMRRKLYEKCSISFPDGVNVMEDKYVMIKLMCFSDKIKHISKAYYHYVKYNETSITAEWDKCIKVENDAVCNLNAILSFLDETAIRNLVEQEMIHSKLVLKRERLNALTIKSFERWKNLFPETNKYVFSCPYMTWKQRLLGWCISHDWWWMANIWIKVRKKKYG